MVVWRVLSTQRQRRISDLARLLAATNPPGIAARSGQGFVAFSRNVGSSPQAFQSASSPDDPEGAVARKKSILGLDFLSKLFHRNQVSPAAVQQVEQEVAEEPESDPANENEYEGEIQAQEDGAYRLEEVESGVEAAGLQEEATTAVENAVEEIESGSVVEAGGEAEALEAGSALEVGGAEAEEVGGALEAGSGEALEARAGEVLEANATEVLEAETAAEALETVVAESTAAAPKKSLGEMSTDVQEFIKGLPPIPPAVDAPAAAAAAPVAPAPVTETKSPEKAKPKPAAAATESSTKASTKTEKPESGKIEKEEKLSEKAATPAAKPEKAKAAAATATAPKAVPSKAAKKNANANATTEKTNAAINMLLESVEKSGKSPSPAAPIFEALNAKPEETPAEAAPPTPPPSLRLSLSSTASEPAPMDAKTLMVEMNTRITDGKNAEAIALFEEWRRTINPLTLECNKPDRTLYNLYMQAKLKEETKFEELQEVVTEMEESGLPRDLAGYNILIRALFRKKDSATAEKLLERMEKEEPHAQPDADSYNLVVVLCSHDRKVITATKYMKTMLEKGFEPSRTTINEVVLATARSHQTKLAVSLLKDLKAQKLPLPMMNTCAELLMAASEVDDAECARLALAAITERPMAKFGPKMVLDEGTMICVLGTAARTGDATLCNHAWDALTHHTQSIGKLPSVEGYLARIHALAVTGDVATAFRAVWEYEVHHGRKQETDSEAFSPFTSLKSLASACSRGGAAALDAAYYRLEEANAKKQGVALAAINCVIQGCANLWDSERAFQTFEAIENVFGLRPDIHSCNALLHALGRTKMTEDALKVYDYVKEAGFKPDKWTYMLLTDAHVVNHDPNSALDVLQTMVEDKHRPFRQTTVKVWTRCKQQEDNDALERLQKLEEALNYRQSFFANARRKLLLDVIRGDRPVPPMGLDPR